MDKHKQFTETVHPIGATIDPSPSLAMPVSKSSKKEKFKFSEADLSSDFEPSIDPSAAAQKAAEVKEPEFKEAPPAPPTVIEALSASSEPAFAQSKPEGNGLSARLKPVVGNRFVLIGGALVVAAMLIGGGVLFGMKSKAPTQMVADSSQLDETTLFIDSKKKTVGVKAATNPDGLQVGATVSATAQGSANIRMGLINGTDPSILFEDGQKNTWQILGSGASFQIIQGTQTRAKLDDKALSLTNALNVGSDANVAGNTTLGSAAGSILTVQGTKVAIPNNLSFNDNTLFIEANKGNVAVGAATASGYRLLINGTFKANGNIFTDGQVLAAPGSAKGPSFSFTNNGNTGLYQASLNAVGIAAGGTQVLQVQQGSLFTVNGANIEADGYLRAGRGGSSPFFQVARYTGVLDGSGSATIADGLPTGYARVLTVQGFYRGNSNEALPLNIDFVNGGSFQISGGIPGRQYRATLIYSADTAGW